MRIRCPFCGERGSGEFTYLGADVSRPNPDTPQAHSEFFEAVYVRENPAGKHEELWYHASGCRSWLIVARDTRTHEIFAVEFAKGAVSA
jgi:methylglutamate dehydrogenase subunit B